MAFIKTSWLRHFGALDFGGYYNNVMPPALGELDFGGYYNNVMPPALGIGAVALVTIIMSCLWHWGLGQSLWLL